MKILKALALLLFVANLPLAFAEVGLVKVKAANGTFMDALPGQVIVKYRPGRTAHAKSRIFGTFSTKTFKRIDPIEMEVLKVPNGHTIESFIKRLQEDPDVEFATPNGIVHASFSPDDPAFTNNSQYGLLASKLNMPQAWDITQGSATTIVAVLDTGITITHPDLINQLWVSTGMTIGIDWNGDNGTEPLDTDPTCSSTSTFNAGSDQLPMTSPLDNNLDNCAGTMGIYHGTRVSGIIAAQTNNTTNIAGICPNCKIMAVKVLNAKGNAPFSSVAEGIIYASTNGAKVINMSLGGASSDPAMQSAVNYALSQNIVIVAASGNDGDNTVDYPAALSGVIAVGSTGITDSLSTFSNRGSALDLVAPGEGIITTLNVGITSGGEGTSFAAPMVAGVAALVRSIAPTMTYNDVTQYINVFSDDLGSTGFDVSYGYGRLDAYRTLTAVLNGTEIPSDRATPGKTYPKPNPFTPGIGQTVEFAVPEALGTGGLEIKIKNVAGDTIKTLSGTRFWDGKNDDGNYVASGLYFYFVKTSAGDITGKLTVIK